MKKVVLTGSPNVFYGIFNMREDVLTNAYLGAIVNNSDDAIISKDLDGVIMSWNDGAERIFGYTGEEAIGRPITMLIPDQRLDEEEEILKRLRQGERIDHFETVRKRKDGTLVDISLTVSPVKNAEGKIVGASKIARDITARKKAQKKLEQMNETLEGRVADRTEKLHSYQQQLRSLASQLNKAEEQERQRLATELHDTLGQTLAAAKMKLDGLRSRQLSNQVSAELQELKEILDHALQYNQNLMMELKPPPVLNKEDATEMLHWTASKMEKKGLEIEIKDDGQPKPVEKEIHSILHQSVRELLQNVIKHADSKKAWLEITSEKSYLKVTVKDKGRGFDIKENELDPAEGGRFGLFNIKERIDWHGGKFNIYSRPGEGTKAVLYVPLKKDQAETSKDQHETHLPPDLRKKQLERSQKVNVLLVDDHDMVRCGLRQVVEKEDDIVIIGEASNGQEAVELARRDHPDIIIMDVNMPVMNGIEATQIIKKEMPCVRIIGLSLHESQEVAENMQNAGASAYLTKSEAFESLITTIRAESGFSGSKVK
ncbi:PAS domain S-box protein [Fodinibius sediminis]|uniref:PAS domain S-box-containing protein n=1 Tax=Fodinibius sediminis TaxID=1214077 RepID=A0A521EDZ3_9BACT|nr:PAS domain S-box protein [Fodinibius sediminis]SMO82095.1 PAS domain S-box-containing protein [Fodinibius sediminis]